MKITQLIFSVRSAILALALLGAPLAFAQPDLNREPMNREDLRDLAAVYSLLQSGLPIQPDGRMLIQSAIRGMVRAADPDGGEYFSPSEFADFRSRRGAFSEVIGMEVLLRDESYRLVPLSGRPAYEAGVRTGDYLYAINGRRVRGLSVDAIEQLLAGPIGTTVNITVFRESSLSVLTLSTERRTPPVEVPSFSRPAADIAMLRLSEFRQTTLREAGALLTAEWRHRAFKKLILDLRGCRGGLLDVSVGVATMFLPPGTIVAKAVGRAPGADRTYYTTPISYAARPESSPPVELPAEIRAMPLAVLIDASTYAGAELVAAALKDHSRAIVVGEVSAGRASIQTVTRLSGQSGLKYTTAFWTSPSGYRIDRVGVIPNREVNGASGEAAVSAAVDALNDR